jgi:hypothetical protein
MTWKLSLILSFVIGIVKILGQLQSGNLTEQITSNKHLSSIIEPIPPRSDGATAAQG